MTTSDGSEVAARAVIIATRVSWHRLDVPTLEALIGAGVFYGAAGAEARAVQGRDEFVVGAGNSTGQAAMQPPSVREQGLVGPVGVKSRFASDVARETPTGRC